MTLLISCVSNSHEPEPGNALPARMSPVRLDAGGAAHDGDAWALFDRDTQSGWSPPSSPSGEPARVRVVLDGTQPLDHIKIFGASPYLLVVRTAQGDPIPGLDRVRLDELGAGWNTLPISGRVAANELVLEFSRTDTAGATAPVPTAAATPAPAPALAPAASAATPALAPTAGATAPAPTAAAAPAPATAPAPIEELELWGTAPPVPQLAVSAVGALAARSRVAAPGVDVIAADLGGAPGGAPGGVIDLAPGAGSDGPACATLHFSLTRAPASYRRAWIAYAADGAFRSFVLSRALNAATLRRGSWIAGTAGAGPLVDPIDPETLVRGDNQYDLCLADGATSHVVVHDAWLIGELDRGSNAAFSIAKGPVDGIATAQLAALLDPENAVPVELRTGQRLVVALDRWIAPDAVVLRHATGSWAIDCLDDAGRAMPLAALALDATGDQTVMGVAERSNELACAALAVRPTGGATASLTSVAVIGSGARARIDWPTIHLASAAEHFGHLAWVDGWVSVPRALGGTATIDVASAATGMTGGVYGNLLSRGGDAAAPWPVTVTAHFADGTHAVQTFVLDQTALLERSAAVTDGALSEADLATLFGAPGQTTTVALGAKSGLTSVRLGSRVGVDIPGGAVTSGVNITVKHLAASELPPLDPGLVNVTAPDAHGFEFLPHGQQFTQPADVILPFDPALFPPGYTSDDVHSYFYNTDLKRWQRLARASVDDKDRVVHSKTDHFTTMIDAVVVSPEHPEIRQFDPNAISGIQAGDPGAGIRVIEAPASSSQGDASLSYALDLPPGRRGLAPAPALTYSSSHANGWVGLGWDLRVGAITIDTRFGAARYDCDVESETYALDGEQLTPIAHRGPDRRRGDDTTTVNGEPVKVFHARVEGGFRRILRHGADTRSYWWEVIDKAGTRSFFGGTPESHGPLDQATLRSDRGDVSEWALVEIRDLHGNAIRYDHDRVINAGFAAGTVPGATLYPAAIRYTFEPGAATAPYEIGFIREPRPDTLIDGRGGFKRVTAERLQRIEVRFQGQLVRAWQLGYLEGAFHKSLLASIQPLGASNTPFVGSAHRFEYFDEIRDTPSANSSFKGFAPAATWGAGDDHIRALSIPGPAVGLLGTGEASLLGGSDTTSGGGHSYIGFNPLTPTKQGSFGGKVGFRSSSSDAALALVDVDGDGLPDKLFSSDTGIVYRPNLSGPAGATRFAGATRPLPGLASLGAHDSSMFSFGFEAYPSVFSLVFNVSDSFTREDRYFADVNGDGLPDFVEPGAVRFNTHTPGGQVFVADDSGATPLPITTSAVDPNGLVPDFTQLAAQNAEHFPPIDAVRRWTAPYAGTVQITGAAQLRVGSPLGDGVRVAIQHNTTELWSETIAAGDTTPKPPANVSAVVVAAGDRLYFRTSAGTDARDHVVDWDPAVEYTGTAALSDPNLRNERRFQASSDFVLAGRDGMFVTVPFDGIIKLVGTVTKAATTDDVTLEVLQHRDASTLPNPVLSIGRSASSTTAFAVDDSLAVRAGDRLELRFRVDSPIDLTALGFPSGSALHWQYVSATNQAGNPVTVADSQGRALEIPAPFDMDSYGLRAPAIEQPSFVAAQSGTLRVLASVQTTEAAPVAFTIKRPGALVAKHGFAASDTAELAVQVNQGDALYFDFSTRDPEARHVLASSVQVTFDPGAATGDPAPSLLHFPGPTNRCPRPYRGWSYGGLNAARVPPGTVIPDDEFCRETTSFDQDTTLPVPGDLDGLKTQGQQLQDEVLTFAVVPFPAGRSCAIPNRPCDLPQQPLWGGVDEQLYFLPAVSSGSRQGPDDLTVPTGASLVHGTTVSRLSRTTQIAESAGAGTGGISGSISNADGTSEALVDYLDMNGDGFPDVVGHGAIQYTSSHGSLGSGPACRSASMIDTLRSSTTSAQSIGLGGSSAEQIGNAKGRAATTGTSPGNGAGNGTQMVSIGLSLSGNVGNAESNVDLLDINGDGLPDQVFHAGGTLMVALNVGYGFLAPEPFADAAINTGNSVDGTIGGDLGFNDGIYGFAAGASASRGESATVALGPGQSAGATLADINGDGLLDQVLPSSGNSILVGINTGSGFAPAVRWSGAPTNDISHSASLSVGGGGYFTIGVPLCLAACYLIINPGAEFNLAMDRQEVALRDIDGDGFPDHLSSTASDELIVAPSLIHRTNLLRKITRPMGATIELDYARVGNTFEQPHSQFVLSRVVTFDGVAEDWSASNPGADFQLTTFRYDGGFYDRREREFYGYAQVESTVHDTRGLVGGVPEDFARPYLRTTRSYRNDSFFTKGLLVSERVEGLDTGAPRLFYETEQQYVLREVDTQQALTTPAALAETLSPVFPELRTTIRRHSEGDASATVQTQVDQRYDADGNIIQIVDAGDAGTADDYTATISYTGHGGGHADCATRHIVGLADSITVVAADGTLLRQRASRFDCTTADLVEFRETTEGSATAVSNFAYAANGNLTQVARPENLHGQRYTMALAYDAPTQSHVVQINDSFGQLSTSAYDLRFGLIASDTDDNGNSITSSYDDFGRLTSVVGPFETGSGLSTIGFDYHPEAAVPYARTANIDVFRDPADPIETVVFSDGFRRIVQSKRDGTLHTGAGSPAADAMIVTGCVAFDHMGRTFEVHYPTSEPKSAANLAFNRACDQKAPPTTTAFDVLGRPLITTLPDGAATRMAYALGADRQGQTRFTATTTDPLGARTVHYRDSKDRVVAIQQVNASRGELITTEYTYDPTDQLVAVRDDHGNITRASYDIAGRLRVLDSPDAGKVETRYDAANNITQRISSKLRAASQAISYDYDFTRMVAIHYPNFPENDVAYQYGSAAQLGQPGNLVGRIIKVSDASGSEQRAYDKLGQVIEEIKTVASKTQGSSDNSPEVWTTRYVYDTWGRLQQMTYPDGEVLTYAYDSGGLVRAASGVKLGTTTPYLQRLEYDEFGHRAFARVGNGVETRYSYDPRSLRLSQLAAGDFQNLRYGYDLVGNITTLSNQVPIPAANQFGGPVEQTFAYDGLYRLTQATGQWQFAPNKLETYALTLAYDTIHNLTRKTQSHSVVTPGGSTVPQKKTTYDFAYAYAGRPHAATTIGDRAFSYDPNGNQAGWDDLTSGQHRTIIWDDEDRVNEIRDNGRTTAFVYDDAGQRVIKRGAQGETAYVNQFWTVRNRSVATKHIFAGDMRIASKVIPGDANIDPGTQDPFSRVLAQWWQQRAAQGWQGQSTVANPHYPGNAMPDLLPEDNFVYFYHPDHLSSTSFATAASGDLFEHLEFFPFGETWVSQQTNTQRLPFLFTGKELDEETGLYYFGARYYDPRTSVWQSADPILDRYIAGAANGGVYRPANLALYSYSWNNPVALRDPDGKVVDTVLDVGFTLFDVGKLVYDEVRGKKENRAENLLALGADAAAIFVPFATGAGVAVRVAKGAERAAEVTKAVEKTGEAVKAVKTVEETKTAVQAVEETKAAVKTVEETGEVAKTTKSVPNPYGRKGGPAHQSKVEEIAADIESRGLLPRTEHKVSTPGGHKETRYIDVVAKDAKGNVVEMHQVGRQTKGGNPVSREVKALDDVQGATNQRPTYHPYNN